MINRNSIIKSTQQENHETYDDFSVISTDEDCREVNRIVIKNESDKPLAQKTKRVDINPQIDRCIVVRDLYTRVKTYCDKVFFNSVSVDEFLEFTNRGLKAFWDLKPEGWNFSLSDRIEISLDSGKCAYELPTDFYGLSYVSASSKVSDCMPVNQVFEIKDYVVWDTISSNKYAASYKYDNVTDRCNLYIRMPCMTHIDGDCCNSSRPLNGSVQVKYYTVCPEVKDLDDKICNIPKRWGGGDILVQLIAQYLHAYKGRPYVLEPSFNKNLAKLKNLDSGKVLNNPIDRKESTKFSIVHH